MKTPPDRTGDTQLQWQTPRVAARLALAGFLGVVGFYLWTEHRAHLFGALPYLLLLACPVMHLFMHRCHPPHAGAGIATDAPADARPKNGEINA